MSFLLALFVCECIVSLASLSLFCLIPITPILLIAYTCNQLASLEFMIAAIISSGKESGKPQNHALPKLSFKFLLLSFIISGLAVALEVLRLVEIPCWVLIVLNVLLQGYYLVKAVVISSGAAYISGVEKKATGQLIKFEQFLGEAKQCYALASEEGQRKMLKKICEAIQYSDPVGRPEIAEDDKKIKTLLEELRQSVPSKPDKLEGICRDLLQTIQMRNDNLRMLKMEGR